MAQGATRTGSRSLVATADQRLEEGRLDESLRLCAEILDAHPRFIPAWFLLARVHAASGAVDDARAWVSAVLDASPGHAGARRLKGILGEPEPPEDVIPEAEPAPPDEVDPEPEPARRPPSPPPQRPPAPRGSPPPRWASSADATLAPPSDDEWDDADDEVEDEGEELATETLGDLYAGQGDVEAARRIYTRVLARGESERVRKKLDALGAPAAVERDPRIPALERFLNALTHSG